MTSGGKQQLVERWPKKTHYSFIQQFKILRWDQKSKCLVLLVSLVLYSILESANLLLAIDPRSPSLGCLVCGCAPALLQ